jgi:hypothetical protein
MKDWTDKLNAGDILVDPRADTDGLFEVKVLAVLGHIVAISHGSSIGTKEYHQSRFDKWLTKTEIKDKYQPKGKINVKYKD